MQFYPNPSKQGKAWVLATRILLLPLGSSSLSKASAIGDGAAFCITRRTLSVNVNWVTSWSAAPVGVQPCASSSPFHPCIPISSFPLSSSSFILLFPSTCTQLCYMHSALLHALSCVTCTQLCYMHSGVSHALSCVTCTQVCPMYSGVLHVLRCVMHSDMYDTCNNASRT